MVVHTHCEDLAALHHLGSIPSASVDLKEWDLRIDLLATMCFCRLPLNWKVHTSLAEHLCARSQNLRRLATAAM